jgi:hypothetical protein
MKDDELLKLAQGLFALTGVTEWEAIKQDLSRAMAKYQETISNVRSMPMHVMLRDCEICIINYDQAIAQYKNAKNKLYSEVLETIKSIRRFAEGLCDNP